LHDPGFCKNTDLGKSLILKGMRCRKVAVIVRQFLRGGTGFF